MNSTLTHLECTACGDRHSADELQNVCRQCGKVLYARYDLVEARQTLTKESLRARPATLWRYAELLPVRRPENVLSLGEGFTPLLPLPRIGAELGLTHLYVKEEGLNPTGSFKARGLSVAVSKAKELGATTLAIPTAGNAGGALAAYAARGGLTAHVVMPKDAPAANQLETSYYGASVTLVDGLINDAGRLVRERCASEGWFDVSTLKEPYRAEGKKTMGFELAEQFDWTVPDVIVYPTGGGTGIVGMWKAFEELQALGLIGPKRPRMVVIQSTGCASLVRAFDRRAKSSELWENAQTIAAGMRVPQAFADYLILDAVYESGGSCVAVSDAELLGDMRDLAQKEGLFASPEGAATLSGLKQLVGRNWVRPDERVVLFNTGSALKYPELLGD